MAQWYPTLSLGNDKLIMQLLSSDVVVDKLHYYSRDEITELRNYVLKYTVTIRQKKLDKINNKLQHLKRR